MERQSEDRESEHEGRVNKERDREKHKERERWSSLTWPPGVKINHELQSVLKCRPAAETSERQ